MSIRVFSVIALAGVVWGGCAPTHQIGLIPARMSVVRSYDIGMARRAVVGENLFEVQVATAFPAFTVTRDYDPPNAGLARPMPMLRAGTRFSGYNMLLDEPNAWILRSDTYSQDVGIVVDSTGRVTHGWIYVSGSIRGAVPVQTSFDTSVRFERVHPDVVETSRFRAQLVYTGMTGNTLKAVYREFDGDMIRPAFTTELQYNLDQSRTVTYKSVRMTIDDVHDGSVTYHVTDDGDLPWLPR